MVAVVKRDETAPADPLDALASEAQSLGGDAPEDGAQAEPAGENAGPVPLTNAQCIAMALQTIREALCAIAKVKSPKQTMDDSTVQVCADAIGPVFDKYRINLAGVAGDYMIEFRAVATVVPIVLAASAALLDEIRAAKATPVEPAGDGGPATNDG